MSKFVLKYIHHHVRTGAGVTSSAAASPTHNPLHFLQSQSFSSPPSSLKSIGSCSNRSSFTVNYLINSCGFTPEKALSASKYTKLKAADKPDSVLAFFKDHGFTQTQISNVVKGLPPVLLCKTEKTLLPKIEFLNSKGFSHSDIAVIISKQPVILISSLENQIIPFFNFLSIFFQSDEKAITAFKSFAGSMTFANANHSEAIIEMLKQAGMPIKNIRYLVRIQPRTLLTGYDRFKQILEQVNELGIIPSKTEFVLAVLALISISKSTWDRKVEIYKRWGWSENDVVHAFKKNPWCMVASEQKVTSMMQFLVNKMGLKSLALADRPKLLSLSLEKRIIPRCEVFQALMSKGVISPRDFRLVPNLIYSGKIFQEKFIDPHKEEYPELMKLYKQKVGSRKIRSGLEDCVRGSSTSSVEIVF